MTVTLACYSVGVDGNMRSGISWKCLCNNGLYVSSRHFIWLSKDSKKRAKAKVFSDKKYSL